VGRKRIGARCDRVPDPDGAENLTRRTLKSPGWPAVVAPKRPDTVTGLSEL